MKSIKNNIGYLGYNWGIHFVHRCYEKNEKFLDNLGKAGGWFSKPELQVSEVQSLNPTGKLPVKTFKFSVKVLFLRAQDASAATGAASPAAPSKAASGALPADAASKAGPVGVPKV